MTGSVQIGKEMKDMKKEIKEYTDMEKSCKNCSLYQGNSCEIFHATEDVAGSGCKADEFYCSLFEPKKKTVKLYAYLKEDDGFHELIWHTHRRLNTDRYARVPGEDKEVQI